MFNFLVYYNTFVQNVNLFLFFIYLLVIFASFFNYSFYIFLMFCAIITNFHFNIIAIRVFTEHAQGHPAMAIRPHQGV